MVKGNCVITGLANMYDLHFVHENDFFNLGAHALFPFATSSSIGVGFLHIGQRITHIALKRNFMVQLYSRQNRAIRLTRSS